jgi:single-stranded DNA-specific DHH superfamily exonuclease
MGHGEERSRGASRLRDWPDAEWLAVRQDHANPRSPRFLSAFGRDVDVREFRLDYDPQTRHLAAGDGNRADARMEDAHRALLALLAGEPGLSKNQIELRLAPEHTQRAVREAVRAAVERRHVQTERGPRNALLHSITEEGRSASVR